MSAPQNTTPSKWPSDERAEEMLGDARQVLAYYPVQDGTKITETACHVIALMDRVRELEAVLAGSGLPVYLVEGDS